MIPAAWMTVGVALSTAVAFAAFGRAAGADVLLGMLAPWLAVSASWIAVERELAHNPAGVHALLMRAFGIKVVFFAAYVVVVMQGLGVRSTPFVVSFTASFISLYCAEALGFARLFAAELRRAR